MPVASEIPVLESNQLNFGVVNGRHLALNQPRVLPFFPADRNLIYVYAFSPTFSFILTLSATSASPLMGFFSSPPEPPSPPAQPSRSAAPNPLISVYRHLSSLERADEALKIIHQLASRVIPIMRKRNWKVGTLAEFLPDHPALQGLSHNWGCAKGQVSTLISAKSLIFV